MAKNIEMHLDGVDVERRTAVLKLVRGAAFAVPVVTSFALEAKLSIALAGADLTASGAPG